jgi:hypothetical protein
MAKFGPYEIQTEDLDRQLDRIVKLRRNPGAYLERLDKAAKKEGATNAQRRAAMRMVEKRFNSLVSGSKAGMDRAQADAAAGKRVGSKARPPLTAEKIAAAKKSFSGAVASIMDDMMNPEPSQEGKPYGGSKELKEATRKAIKQGAEAIDYKTQKKAGGGKVYAMNRRMAGPIRKPRMK